MATTNLHLRRSLLQEIENAHLAGVWSCIRSISAGKEEKQRIIQHKNTARRGQPVVSSSYWNELDGSDSD